MSHHVNDNNINIRVEVKLLNMFMDNNKANYAK